MRKVVTILTLAFALASSVVLVTAVTAEAHEHQICTPGYRRSGASGGAIPRRGSDRGSDPKQPERHRD